MPGASGAVAAKTFRYAYLGDVNTLDPYSFDETVQLSNQWLNELMRAVDWDDKHRAYRLLRATLHALRDRLTAQCCLGIFGAG